MNPILETTQNHMHHPYEELGYKIANTDQAIKKALYRALEIWKKMRWSGAETRMWTAHVEIDAKQKLDGIRLPEVNQNGDRLSYDRKFREIADWEKNILSTIRRYMTESNEMINQIKTLNPPLSTDHIKPIIKAMEKDQISTLTALNPIKLRVDQIAEIRERLREAPRPFLNYNPVY